jgi:diacylglycerol kinase family enzyme
MVAKAMLNPLGSVNDHVENLKIPTNLRDAAEVIAKGEFLRIDLGMIINHAREDRHHFLICIACLVA